MRIMCIYSLPALLMFYAIVFGKEAFLWSFVVSFVIDNSLPRYTLHPTKISY